jgi:6,7-dimethyl-8-ribityllumazine synthase
VKAEDGAGSATPSRPDCSGKRFALVAARFYPELTDQMLEGARNALRECGVTEDAIDVYDVPGCFELPFACRKLAGEIDYDGFVALGVVIRGETPHFDYVAGECARGLMHVQLEIGVPIGFGVLTTETLAQAQERADPARGNKGFQAALAASELAALQTAVSRAGFRR